MIATVLLVLFLVLLALRMPVSISMGVACLVALIMGDYPLSLIPRYMSGGVESFPLMAVPFFIFAGNLMNSAGITTRIFNFASRAVGHLPGGLAIATVFGCAGFAACTGASTASAAIMGRIAIPEMRKYGYHPRLAAGVVAASGTLASLIPPSVILVIYGIITEESIGELLIGGFIPGIVSAAIYAAMIYGRVKISPELGKLQPRVSWKV